MCGLAGFWNRSGDMSSDALQALTTRMTDTIVHRGPDDGGAWVDAERGISLGFRR